MGKSARETHDLLKVTFGDEAWDWSALCEWHKHFKSRHELWERCLSQSHPRH